jgi:hypothetical protein
MKRTLLFVALLACLAGFSQSPVAFTTSTHAFGKIKQGKPVSFLFAFKNTASKPAVIENAEADCGCTTPEYPKEPIAPGQTGNIKVTYNAAGLGAFTKHVRIKLATQQDPITLTISGEVLAAPAPAHK